MRLLLGSDYHGRDPLLQEALELLPECDGYINCGDFCSLAGRKPKEHGSLGYHPRAKAEIELLQSFCQQVDERGKPWIFVPGNHDPSAPILETLPGSWGRVAMECQVIAWLGLWVLVVPYTPPCGWNWTLRSAHLREWVLWYTTLSQHIAIDLMISHAPPKGALDEGGRWYSRRMPTLRPLLDVVQPRYYICGHMHKDGGKSFQLERTTVINVAERNWILELDP